MALDLTQQRQQAHALLDLLAPEKLDAIRALLDVLVDPISRSLASAPVEEEDLSDETAVSLERSRESIACGESIPHEEILREFGLPLARS